ncbi:hypothetical protein D9758_003156 [Tetrapyrgos nigripes]|uniref:Metallo-beta-lactamase domain-containing protein n=1 Tax=Tetrapyrgos nigripes TaxID=182062 RepID=A0A8H5GIX8_9AGAR|nr:hypothetical protein D9758_003156 [Tetrapyrgos nigripes]
METAMSVTFLGTSSGGGPSLSRNCSSLVADVLGDGSLWMVDCAEGTLRQFSRQPYSPDRSQPRVSQISKMFITHMHADHVMGIIPLLRNVLYPPPAGEVAEQVLVDPSPKIEIFGPAGIRTFVRSILKMTLTKTRDNYVVHELLTEQDQITPCDPPEVMHVNEVAGRDIVCSEDGFWRNISRGKGRLSDVAVDAGPILHRGKFMRSIHLIHPCHGFVPDPCLGFVFRECFHPYRKVVVLGDTNDPSAIIPLCVNPSPSLLVHEATEAHISQDIDPKSKRSFETVMGKAQGRGHSIPQMAGTFAKTIGAQKLVLNHIGGRFPAPGPNDRNPVRANVIAEIERQASEAWGMGSARAAWDFMRVAIPVPTETVGDTQASTSQQASCESEFPTPSHTRTIPSKPSSTRRYYHTHTQSPGSSSHHNNSSSNNRNNFNANGQQHRYREGGGRRADRSERQDEYGSRKGRK